ncbi:hypothetical protein K456DRAFT_34512 [Colletotrichum gloeosporioides 23]|nr:hypothetical protein K456DRAFT_34512 [Colletotrichum gloeosporioides 23]
MSSQPGSQQSAVSSQQSSNGRRELAAVAASDERGNCVSSTLSAACTKLECAAVVPSHQKTTQFSGAATAPVVVHPSRCPVLAALPKLQLDIQWNATSTSPRWSHSRGPNTSAIPQIHTFCNQFDVGQDSTENTDEHGQERSDSPLDSASAACCLSSSALQESQTLGDDQNATHRPGQSRACASRTTAGGINTNRNERESRPTVTKTIHEKKQWKTLIHRSSQTLPQAKMNGASTPRTIPATPSPHRAYCPLLRFRPQSSHAAGTDCKSSLKRQGRNHARRSPFFSPNSAKFPARSGNTPLPRNQLSSPHRRTRIQL